MSLCFDFLTRTERRTEASCGPSGVSSGHWSWGAFSGNLRQVRGRLHLRRFEGLVVPLLLLHSGNPFLREEDVAPRPRLSRGLSMIGGLASYRRPPVSTWWSSAFALGQLLPLVASAGSARCGYSRSIGDSCFSLGRLSPCACRDGVEEALSWWGA